ncbi:MAG: nucleotidyltransferase domain-containing protein [Lachnospiraceae bacterium]|nr:nucleotidyltransferase domain-containing protein [Lachnospiraceae bacterium]
MTGIGGLRPDLIRELTGLSRKHSLEKLLLFGSRARGDYKERSDIDLAAYGGNVAAFSLDAEEETHTLLMYDIVDMNSPVQESLRTSIEAEGVLIYEKV